MATQLLQHPIRCSIWQNRYLNASAVRLSATRLNLRAPRRTDQFRKAPHPEWDFGRSFMRISCSSCSYMHTTVVVVPGFKPEPMPSRTRNPAKIRKDCDPFNYWSGTRAIARPALAAATPILFIWSRRSMALQKTRCGRSSFDRYQIFLARFPTLLRRPRRGAGRAGAVEAGLGYYSAVRGMFAQGANFVANQLGGKSAGQLRALRQLLPASAPITAAAIASIAQAK